MTVILPCRDEAAALPQVLSAIPDGWAAVVVDNGSIDDSAVVAREHGARVICEPRPGYGAAVQAGLEGVDTELVAVMDADGSLDPSELPGLVTWITRGRADLVCGRRRPLSPDAWPWHARMGNALLAAIIRGSTGTDIHDIAPVRVARRQALLDLELVDRRCGYPLETFLAAAGAGWRVVERPVSYRRRAAGTKSKISGTLRGTLTVLVDFSRVLVRFALTSSSSPSGDGSSEPLETRT